jgi:hypothetical protein
MNYSMMLCHIVAIDFFAWGSVVSKLSSTFSVAEPMVFHFHCFQFLDDVVVDNAKCSGVVRLHWGGDWGWPMKLRVWWVGMASLQLM